MMKASHILAPVALAALMAGATACTGNKGWNLDGDIAGAADTTIYLEAATFNNWRTVDSLHVDGDGNFSYAAPEAAAVPTIYRLRFGDKYIYFPVDSIETVTVSAKAARFDRGFRLSGNSAAAGFQRADSLIAAAVDAQGDAAAGDAALKQQLNLMINQDTTCLVSYYIIGKTVGNRPLYNLSDRTDIRTLGNAANNYLRLRPNDPRAKELEQRWIGARRAIGATGTREVEIQASQSGRPTVDLKRYDAAGKLHDFEKIVTRGGVTVLNFTRYDGEYSPANTLALRKVYDAYHSQGVEIFQIAYDPDEVAWKESAKNMPWIAVYNSSADPIDALVAYNVDPINGAPVSFVFNRAGELVTRVTDPERLSAAVAANL